ncbi:unnamed protein product, partial [Phaeothamnion confervicola]
MVARAGVHSGYLMKLGGNIRRWKRRFFVLRPITMLFYYLTEHDTEPRGCIDVDIFCELRKFSPQQPANVKNREARPSSPARRDAAATAAEGATANSDDPPQQGPVRFELTYPGCPEGQGFLMEVASHAEWLAWVEAVGSSRHSKLRGEVDVLRTTNSILKDEVTRIKAEAATLRQYANQRHVTTLALRDEREQRRELLAELAVL